MRRPEPDQAALEIAHRLCAISLPFDDAIKHPVWGIVIKARACKHMRQRDKFDLKKLQANDND